MLLSSVPYKTCNKNTLHANAFQTIIEGELCHTYCHKGVKYLIIVVRLHVERQNIIQTLDKC